MLTVPQAMQQYMDRLNLLEDEKKAASSQQTELYEQLSKRFHPKEPLVSGSYGRRTAVRPLKDIDLFLVLPAPDPRNPQFLPPAGEFLESIRRGLQTDFPGKPVRVQRHSVNIVMKGEIGFDVVPALEVPGESNVYRIPEWDLDSERATGKWIRTNPRMHEQLCNEANARAGNMLKPLIKVLRGWNQRQGKPVPSFLLEALSYKAFTQAPASYALGLAELFRFLSDRIQRPCADPAGIGPDLDAKLDGNRREQARSRLGGEAGRAGEALARERNGDLTTAHQLWAKILGPDYRWR